MSYVFNRFRGFFHCIGRRILPSGRGGAADQLDDFGHGRPTRCCHVHSSTVTLRHTTQIKICSVIPGWSGAACRLQGEVQPEQGRRETAIVVAGSGNSPDEARTFGPLTPAVPGGAAVRGGDKSSRDPVEVGIRRPGQPARHPGPASTSPEGRRGGVSPRP